LDPFTGVHQRKQVASSSLYLENGYN